MREEYCNQALVYLEFAETTARYIRIDLECDDAWLFLDEVVVNPVAAKLGQAYLP